MKNLSLFLFSSNRSIQAWSCQTYSDNQIEFSPENKANQETKLCFMYYKLQFFFITIYDQYTAYIDRIKYYVTSSYFHLYISYTSCSSRPILVYMQVLQQHFLLFYFKVVVIYGQSISKFFDNFINITFFKCQLTNLIRRQAYC